MTDSTDDVDWFDESLLNIKGAQAMPKELWVTVNLRDAEKRVRVEYTPGHPAVHYLPNGDPGYPAEPPEVEVLEVVDALDPEDDTLDVEDLTLEEHEQIFEKACKAIEDEEWDARCRPSDRDDLSDRPPVG